MPATNQSRSHLLLTVEDSSTLEGFLKNAQKEARCVWRETHHVTAKRRGRRSMKHQIESICEEIRRARSQNDKPLTKGQWVRKIAEAMEERHGIRPHDDTIETHLTPGWTGIL